MYLSLRDRPPTPAPPADPQAARRVPRVPRVPRVVVTLGFVSLLTDISSESAAAILPLYLTAVVGLSPAAYGVVDGLYQGVSALVRILAGWASDRTQRPKEVALLGYAGSAAARAFLPFATGLAAVSAVVTADRIGKGVRTAPRDAMIAAGTDPAHLGRAFGVHRMLDAVGALLGPLIAFAVLWAIPEGYRTVLVVSLGFAVLGVALLALFVPGSTGARPPGQPGSPTEPRPPRPTRPTRGVLAAPGLLRLSATAGGLGLLTIGDGFVYLVLLDAGGFAAHWFPVLYIGTSAAYLLLAVPFGRLADRHGRVRVMVLAHLALAAAYLCATAVAGRWVALGTLAAVLLLGTFYAATDGVLAAAAGRLAPPSARASGIAVAQTAVAVARLLSAAGFGVLWLLLGPGAAVSGMAALLVLAVPVALLAVRGLDRS
ncbi:MFS transporter [Nocardioides pantholopis]|uniref:MFS transporter n=1 Tax=Nocardioides pantholopis TaxID=2483798 RepID=UPI000FD77947|nr:MFS transporter [Nocardioides pantholopis]